MVQLCLLSTRGAYVENPFNNAGCSPPNKWGNPLSFVKFYILRCRSKHHRSYLSQSMWCRWPSRTGSCSARPSCYSCGGTGSASQTIHHCRYSGHTSRSRGLGRHTVHTQSLSLLTKENQHLYLPKQSNGLIDPGKYNWFIQTGICFQTV